MTDSHSSLSCIKLGFWRGPQENEQDFEKRVFALLARSQNFGEHHPHILSANQILQEVFNFTYPPDYIYFSNEGLSFWEGAALWIEESNQITMPLVQLRKSFRCGSFLGYTTAEVLAHELVHAARIAFNDPKYEEMIAYKTASRRWRAYFGPMFESYQETVWFLVIGALSLSISLFFFPVIFLPFLMTFIYVYRLIKKHLQFERAQNKLTPFLKGSRQELALMARLSDKEIDYLSECSLDCVLTFFVEAKDTRIQQIRHEFFV